MSRTAFRTLVSTKWLVDKLASRPENFKLLDASSHNPSTKRSAFKEYNEGHIPTAQFFNLEDCCDTNSKYDTMLPTPTQFADYVGHLGIDNSTHVVVYDTSDYTFYSAPRLWWMFRVFGLKSVSLLEGGINQWKKDQYEITSKKDEVDKVHFSPVFNADMVKSFEDIQNNLTKKIATVVDARSAARFNGQAREPRPGIFPGHILGALNIPFPTLFNSDVPTKSMKSPEQLKAIFDKAAVDLSKPVIASCGSGVTACTLILGAHLIGQDIPLYDGSWLEWYMRAKADQKVSVPVSIPA